MLSARCQHTCPLWAFLDIIIENWGHTIFLADGTDGTHLQSRFIAISEKKNTRQCAAYYHREWYCNY